MSERRESEDGAHVAKRSQFSAENWRESGSRKFVSDGEQIISDRKCTHGSRFILIIWGGTQIIKSISQRHLSDTQQHNLQKMEY